MSQRLSQDYRGKTDLALSLEGLCSFHPRVPLLLDSEYLTDETYIIFILVFLVVLTIKCLINIDE